MIVPLWYRLRERIWYELWEGIDLDADERHTYRDLATTILCGLQDWWWDTRWWRRRGGSNGMLVRCLDSGPVDGVYCKRPVRTKSNGHRGAHCSSDGYLIWGPTPKRWKDDEDE